MPSIAEIASGPNFSILLGATKFIDANVPGSDLVTTLSNPANLTVFAPTNAAFASLASDLGYNGDPEDAEAVLSFLATNVDAGTLNQVVLYHVLPTAQKAVDIAANPTLTTLQGATITADLPTLIDNEPDLIDPSLVATDIMATNGVVHVIDKVLLPIDLPGNDAPTITGIAVASGEGFDTNAEDFDILREAVVAADLAGALDDPNADLTVFAPTDAAFVATAQALGFQGSDEGDAFGYIVDAARLLSKGGDPIPLIKDILLYHVAPESLQASQVLALDEIPTLLGASVGRDGTSLVDGEPDLPNPNLIATDIQAANGVVHVIDGVLVPLDILPSNGANKVDFVIGNDKNSFEFLGADNDWIDAKGGRDFILAGSGDDVVLAGSGNDYVSAGRGDDFVKGEDGRDFLFGGRGNDEIDGGAGHDYIRAGSGADVITGGTGNDYLNGGRGSDTFVFNDGDGHDVIRGFDRGGDDLIDLSSYGFDSFSDIEGHISGGRRGTHIDLGDTEIYLSGTNVHTVTADDFIF